MISTSTNKHKTAWGVVNAERGINKRPPVSFTDVAKDSTGKPYESKKAVTDAMNLRFVGAAAACGAPPACVPRVSAALAAARPPADRSLRLTRFTAYEVYQIVASRIPKKPTKDIYDISIEVINLALTTLAPCLAVLFSRCINDGMYPDAMKLSKISPLFKGKGTRDDIDGYRPVSIIPAVAKIFENGLSARLTDYLTSTGALSERQYAYRAGRSTTSLTREVIRRVLDACEQKQRVAVLCCDLSKAFDVADHGVLAAKLKHYGINGPAHALFTDLLRNRSQVVVGDGGNTRSDPLTTALGVAQGSSVSNILFSLLLNDLPDSIASGEIYMYADDVAAIVTGSTTDELEQRLNGTASELANWFKQNGLVLNLKKTHFLQFSISGRPLAKLQVSIDGKLIEQVNETTFLGFEIDRGLTWSSHIDKLCAKLGSACYALCRLARVVDADIVRTCYFATVHSVLQYGAELWGCAADRLRAFRMQKRAVRAIARVSRLTSVKPYFKSLKIPTLPSLVILQVAVYVRQNVGLVARRGDSHSYNTRGAHKLAAVSRRLARSDKLTHVLGPTIYNRLPEHIVEAPSLNSFKHKLKNWLVEKTVYSIDEFIHCDV